MIEGMNRIHRWMLLFIVGECHIIHHQQHDHLSSFATSLDNNKIFINMSDSGGVKVDDENEL